ncbi:MAG: DEAD/DEAH box helicase, partial [Gemmatimonadaceae bacterium]|nr:DEAD/DEAH box helicase [Gemmatimonadaceae bacterium]
MTDIIDSPETDAPATFAELMLAPELLRAVADAGYTAPTPIQARAIPLI